MRIAQVAPLYERVPPRLYGGTERVVSYLTEALVRLGHRVTLFASGDSVTSAELRPFAPQALRLDSECIDPLASHVRMLGAVYRAAHEFDVIHCHTDYLGLPLASYVATPTVLTLHGRLDIPEIAPVFRDHPGAALVSISDAQRQPMSWASWVATVQHGLPRDTCRPGTAPGDYLLFLGRISPEKRPDTAINVAVRAGVPLKIAAKVDPADRRYYETTVKPLLDHPLVDFIGEVDEAGKARLLSGARALLFPIDWSEPFGLVMIEALACGTPVIARPRGSVREILREGVTAWFGETENELVDAVGRIDALDRRACRTEFERRFTDDVMAANYVEVFEHVVARRAPAHPASRPMAALPARPLPAAVTAPALATTPITPARRGSRQDGPERETAACSRAGGE